MSKESDRNELGRRVANHLEWEKNQPKESNKAKVQASRRDALDREAKKQTRNQRNNRREY